VPSATVELTNQAASASSIQYAVEKELAGRLRTAPREERPQVYLWIQEELSRRLPNHPSLSPSLPTDGELRKVEGELSFLRRFLHRDATFAEIGPGDCRLAAQVANQSARVIAVDIASEASQSRQLPPQCQLLLSDGLSVPIAEDTVDVAYSCELTEHLHPEDARVQLQDIYQALKPGGIYICITPNRLNGPHDGSRPFDAVSTGLHIREYTRKELVQLFNSVGFQRVRAYAGKGGWFARIPVTSVVLCETLLEWLPQSLRARLARTIALRALLGVRLVARKPS
jgi:SAM-dependent methyltransferase